MGPNWPAIILIVLFLAFTLFFLWESPPDEGSTLKMYPRKKKNKKDRKYQLWASVTGGGSVMPPYEQFRYFRTFAVARLVGIYFRLRGYRYVEINRSRKNDRF